MQTMTRGWAWLALAGSVLLWGSSYAATKTSLSYFSPNQLIWLRMVLASLVLLPFWRRLPKPAYRQGDGRWLLLLGLLQPCVYFTCETQAIRFTTSAQAGTIAAMAPLFVALLAWWWLKERLSLPALLGLCCSLIGVGLLSLGASADQAAPNPLLGNSLQLLAMLCIASYMVILKRMSSRYDTWWLTGSQNLLGILFFLPGAWLAGTDHWSQVPWSAWLCVLYLGGIVSLGGFGLYNLAMRTLPAAEAAMSINLVPLLAILMGWLALGEALSPLQGLAALLILGGVLLGQWRPGHKPQALPEAG
ncbi:DMT family transporter [Pseudaeromonas sp. ZJS20]|uniref:DMT family transporter n=1 Tax=Pseudaeromonas aegiceratis TaxID=3153928 RepID=UPI00390CD6E2